MVTQAMHVIGDKHQVILLCDSWYPKAEILTLVEQYDNLHLICNVRSDTYYMTFLLHLQENQVVLKNVENVYH